MRKRKIFNLFATLMVGSVVVSSSIAFFNKDNLNIFKISNNKQEAYTSSVNENNYDVGSVSFIQDTVHEKTTTPYGFLKYDASKKTIYSISFFGNIGWKYSLATSNFIKRGKITDFSKVYMYYISDVDRIVVYGQGNGKSFLFQLNAKDGSEYYVNDNNHDANGSSVISSMDSFAISNLDQISYVNNKIIVLLPNELTSNNKNINTFKINLDSYVASPLNIDLSGFDFQVPQPAPAPPPAAPSEFSSTDDSGETSNVAKEFDTRESNGTYQTKNIIGFVEDSNKSILILSGIRTIGSTKDAGILFVILDQTLKYDMSSFVSFLDNNTINRTSDNDIFSKSFYDFVVQYGTNNKVEKIFTIMKEMPALGSYSASMVGILDFSSRNAKSRSNAFDVSSKDVTITDKSITNDIFYNKKTKKTYILVRDGKVDNQTYGFYDASLSKKEFKYPIVINNKNDKSTKHNLAIKLVNSDIDLSAGSKNIPFIYSYNDFNSSNQWINKKVGSWKLTTSSENNFTVAEEENFAPTQISSYGGITQKYSHYLPQDINQQIFDEFVYLHKINEKNKLFNSTVTIDPNSLTPNNNDGTLKGYINLNLEKWWNYSNPKEKEKIKIDVSLTGLATNAGLNFALVTNSNIDSTKYQQILELQKSSYPSQVTKEQILKNFLKYGENLNIQVLDITINHIGPVVDGNNQPHRSTPSTAITVSTNDDDGTIKIDYDLSAKTSPSALNKTGTATFTNFKQLNTWQQIKWNQAKLVNLKKSKMIFQITKKDIIDCLDLSSSYKRDENLWDWTPTNSDSKNKATYIQNNLEGILDGTISYRRSEGGTPSNVNESFTKLTITKDNQGAGFLKFVEVIGGTNEKTVVYNAEKATQVASLYSATEAEKKAYEIFDQSMTFFNSWTNVTSLDLGKPTVNGNQLTYNLRFSSSKITTNFTSADGQKLVLDSDWINAINTSSQIFNFDRTFSFSFNQTTYQWNYDIPITDTQYEIGNIQTNSSTIINSNDLEHFKTLTPTIFTNIYKSDSNGNYLSFQDRFNLLKVNKSLDPSSIDYFVIKDIQLVPNDEKGTVYVQYEINYPNISNTSLGGETVYPQITLTGFKTLNDQIHQYLIWIIIMAAVIVVMGSSFGGYVYWNKRRNAKQKEKYNRAKKSISLYESQTHVNDFNPLKKSKNLRNTLHSNTLKNAKIREYENNMKSYKKRLKEIDEMEKTKKK